MTRLRKLLSQKIYVSFVGVVMTGLIMTAYLIGSVLNTPLTERPREITVQMDYTGGLYEGSPVTYRGVKIGKITDIRLTEEGIVEATAALITTEKIPESAAVKVRSLSPVGEQYLDFQPESEDGPYLEDGDIIPASATQLPETLGSTVVNIKGLLDQIDADDLQVALKGIARGLEGTGDDIGKLVDQGAALLRDLDANWELTERLLTNGNTVLRIAPSERDNIALLARSGRQFAAFLKDYDPTFRKLLDDAPRQFEQIKQLLRDAEELLPTLLDRTISLNDLLAAREPHFRELLMMFPRGINALSGTFTKDGLELNSMLGTQRICLYGTERRDPKDTTRHPLQTTGHCPASFDGLFRGAAHAPPPLW